MEVQQESSEIIMFTRVRTNPLSYYMAGSMKLVSFLEEKTRLL